MEVDPEIECLKIPFINALTQVEQNKQQEGRERRPTKFLLPYVPSIKAIINQASAQYESRFKEFSGNIQLKIEGRMIRHWKECYLTVKDKILKLYETPTSKQPYISLNFDLVSCRICVVTSSMIQISPMDFSKSLLLKPPAEDKLDDLCISLHSNLIRSVGYNVELNELCRSSRKFWKRLYISSAQFHEIADHGDIMLFKSSSFGSFALRVASNSEYDHVGMIIRGKKGEVFLYECLGAGGVQLNDIDYFLDNDWDKMYQQIAIRKLHCDRTPDFITKFRKFCSKLLGSPYKISAEKLLRKKSILEEKEGYFCSELIAAVYKHVGLLPDELSSCQYWPSSFSSNHELLLVNGAYLGEEMKIIFNQ